MSHQPIKTIKPDLNQVLKELHDFKNFLEYIGGESCPIEELDDMYNHDIVISLRDHKVSVPFNAENYNNLLDLILIAIKEF